MNAKDNCKPRGKEKNCDTARSEVLFCCRHTQGTEVHSCEGHSASCAQRDTRHVKEQPLDYARPGASFLRHVRSSKGRKELADSIERERVKAAVYSIVPPLVAPDDMGLFESALRIILGLQSNWSVELVGVSTDGHRCLLQHQGYKGWAQTSAILSMEAEPWLR